jgi:hypothetical protein
MTVEVTYPHVEKLPDKPARLQSHPRTRISMVVADHLYRGWSPEEIVHQYPYLKLGEVYSALAYYFDHTEEIDSELEAEKKEAEESKKANPTSPVLLRLKRLQQATQR